MTTSVPVAPGRICAERGCRTVLSIWNPLDKCSLHVERHIMPSPGVYINMKDGVPELKTSYTYKPPKYEQCECGRIIGRYGCKVCPASSYLEVVAS